MGAVESLAFIAKIKNRLIISTRRLFEFFYLHKLISTRQNTCSLAIELSQEMLFEPQRHQRHIQTDGQFVSR